MTKYYRLTENFIDNEKGIVKHLFEKSIVFQSMARFFSNELVNDKQRFATITVY